MAAYRSIRMGKPLLAKGNSGRWGVLGDAASWDENLAVLAQKWADRRNYFIGIKAGIALGRALDCTARSCPAPLPPPEAMREVAGYGPFN